MDLARGTCSLVHALISARLAPSETLPRLPGAKYCTLEIDTSEVIVDFQWPFPMDCQWHFPTQFHLSVGVPKGLSLAQWISTGMFQLTFSVFFPNGLSFCEVSCVIFCPNPCTLSGPAEAKELSLQGI